MNSIRSLLAVAAFAGASIAAAGSAPRPVMAAPSVPSVPISWQSAGDSYSSGEGVFGNVGDCAQSDQAYGPLAADALRGRGWEIGSETFTACTGHLVEDYFNSRSDTDGKASLWEWGRQQTGPEQVDVITMSFGGNDIGFANQIVDCLPVPDSWVGYIPSVATPLANLTGCDTAQSEIEERIDALLDPPRRDCTSSRRTGDIDFGCDIDIGDRRGSIIDFYYDIVTQRLTDEGQLYIVGYPRVFAPVDQWPGWVKVSCQGVLRGDTEKLGRIAEYFNTKLDEAVKRANEALGTERVHYIDRLALYRDGQHELCGTGADWLNGIAFDRGDGFGLRKETSFHPNADGHLAVATALTDRVASTFVGPPPPSGDDLLTSCEGLDMGLVPDTLVATLTPACSFPWALIPFTEPQPRLSVALVETLKRERIVYWTDVEDGPAVSGYTVDSIVEYGVPRGQAQAMFDALGGDCASNGGCAPACPSLTVNDRGDQAVDIVIADTDCGEAELLIQEVHAVYSPWSDPVVPAVRGYECTFEELPMEDPGDAGRQGRFTCWTDWVTVQWTFVAGE